MLGFSSRKNSSYYPLNAPQSEAKRRFEEKVKNGGHRFHDIPCLCGATTREAVLLSEKDRYGLAAKIWLCKKCALIYISPYFDPPSLLKFYSDDYRDIYNGLDQPAEMFFRDQRQAGLAILAFIREVIPDIGKYSIFEIGCAAGGILSVFSEQGCRCSGSDLDTRYIAYGVSQGLRLTPGGFDSFEKSATSYDLVLMAHVLEHLPDPRHILQEIRKKLNPDGYLYVEVPNVVPKIEFLGQLQNAHVWYFDLPTLGRLLNDCGFEIFHSAEPFHLRVLARPARPFSGSGVPKHFYARKYIEFQCRESLRAVRRAISSGLESLGLKIKIKKSLDFLKVQ